MITIGIVTPIPTRYWRETYIKSVDKYDLKHIIEYNYVIRRLNSQLKGLSHACTLIDTIILLALTFSAD